MVLSCQPIVDCLKSVRSEDSFVIMMTPQGNRFDQKLAHRFASEIKHLIILCGHYEGFDERIRSFVDMEVSLGDFVLTGGEGAALVISDAVIIFLSPPLSLQVPPDFPPYTENWYCCPDFHR